jgi:manganese/zinc/iron transport system substrate-binding protein
LAQEGESAWEERFAAPEGLAPDGQLNPMDLKLIVDRLQKHRIEMLFPESSVSRDSIRKIAAAGKQMGLEIRICNEALYGDSFQGSYPDAMKHNADVIAKGLNR